MNIRQNLLIFWGLISIAAVVGVFSLPVGNTVFGLGIFSFLSVGIALVLFVGDLLKATDQSPTQQRKFFANVGLWLWGAAIPTSWWAFVHFSKLDPDSGFVLLLIPAFISSFALIISLLMMVADAFEKQEDEIQIGEMASQIYDQFAALPASERTRLHQKAAARQQREARIKP